MASLYKKTISGKPYWYLREMARVGGKPKMVSERYLGSAAEIEALLDAREAAAMPERTRHLAFGDVAAAWGVLDELGVVRPSTRRPGRGWPGSRCPTGRTWRWRRWAGWSPRLQGRVRGPRKTTAAGRFTKILASALDHRRFWDAMHAVTEQQLEDISEKIAVRMVRSAGFDFSSVALDMTNFATFIATGNGKAPIAQRGKAKQKRTDLRIVGLGLVVTGTAGSG